MNRLKDALSPYLLQHRNNPVHWHEWNDAAFTEAKTRNVPIFLSIGYAACHWCHVMAHESFADEITANYLNQHFVCIKVDREERPDIDNIYMQAVLQFAGQGGWPLNMFLTPEGKPFFGGTYFPKVAAYGRISFIELLEKIVVVWQTQQKEIQQTTQELVKELNKPIVSTVVAELPTQLNVIKNYEVVANYLDLVQGGFQGVPKFPQITLWSTIFMIGAVSNNAALINASDLTAEKLCQGGIYDHLGGGWARYSTDANWLAPHFEKMLYDNAQIIEWLTALYAYRPNPLFYQRIKQTIEWLKREMLLMESVFAASLDADSEGEEGKYYVWTWQELASVLGADLPEFARHYGLSEQGNWEGKNILHENHTRKSSLTSAQLDSLREKLFERRETRIKPARDDKILLDWNALMIIALSKAGLIFKEPEWLRLAETTYHGLAKILHTEKGWNHAYRDGKYQTQKMLEDYAHIIRAAISLYCATGEEIYLADARAWLQEANRLFLHPKNGLYNQNEVHNQRLIANPQPIFDSVMPSGNGMMAINLMQLHLLTGEKEYIEDWRKLINAVAGYLVSSEAWHLSSIAQSLIWFYSGIKLETDWRKQKTEVALLPNWLLMNREGMSKINCCNHNECFAQVDRLDSLNFCLQN